MLSFLKKHLGVDGPEAADVEALKLEVTELKQKVESLSEENVELRQKVPGCFNIEHGNAFEPYTTI